jgi:hypothetical protein
MRGENINCNMNDIIIDMIRIQNHQTEKEARIGNLKKKSESKFVKADKSPTRHFRNMTAAQVFQALFDAIVESTPFVSMLALFLLALYQVFDLKLPRPNDDRLIEAIYAVTVSMLMFAVIQALLVKSGQVKKDSAFVIAIATAIVIFAGLLVECAGLIRRRLFGPTLVLLCCYVILYIAVSGSDVLGVPDTTTIAVMACSIAVGSVMIYKHRITELGFRSILRSFVVSTALVYSIVYLVPHILQRASVKYVIVRRLQAYWNPYRQEGMEYAADDLSNFTSCTSSIGCPLRLAIIGLLTLLLSYLTYQKNRSSLVSPNDNTTAPVPTSVASLPPTR